MSALERLTVVDLEASSYPLPGSFPIEVALAAVSTGRLWSSLIRPTEAWRERGFWDPGAERVHGLSLDDLQRWGRPVEEVADELQQRLAGRTVVSDNAHADAMWLQRLADAANLTEPLAHVGDIREVWEDLAGSGGLSGAGEIEAARDEAKRRYPREHRAGDDAMRLAESIRLLAGIDGGPADHPARRLYACPACGWIHVAARHPPTNGEGMVNACDRCSTPSSVFALVDTDQAPAGATIPTVMVPGITAGQRQGDGR